MKKAALKRYYVILDQVGNEILCKTGWKSIIESGWRYMEGDTVVSVEKGNQIIVYSDCEQG